MFWFSLPPRLFSPTWSTVLLDHDGRLLSASIASDGQWRFPGDGEIPPRFVSALLTWEDKRFFIHPGHRPGRSCARHGERHQGGARRQRRQHDHDAGDQALAPGQAPHPCGEGRRGSARPAPGDALHKGADPPALCLQRAVWRERGRLRGCIMALVRTRACKPFLGGMRAPGRAAQQPRPGASREEPRHAACQAQPAPGQPPRRGADRCDHPPARAHRAPSPAALCPAASCAAPAGSHADGAGGITRGDGGSLPHDAGLRNTGRRERCPPAPGRTVEGDRHQQRRCARARRGHGVRAGVRGQHPRAGRGARRRAGGRGDVPPQHGEPPQALPLRVASG